MDGGSLAARLRARHRRTWKRPPGSSNCLRTCICAWPRHRSSRLEAANILLTSDGIPKIADFGLAKSLNHDSGRNADGAILGTPSYMSPEQAAGKTMEIGPASDVYALGGILYELLTGKPPFRARTALETLQMVVEQRPICRITKIRASIEPWKRSA